MMEINFIGWTEWYRMKCFFPMFFPAVDWLGLLDRDGTQRSGDAFKVASLTVSFSREFLASILCFGIRSYNTRVYIALNFFLYKIETEKP